MQQIQISQLKPHPRNNEFFDDIVGENWDAFLESVKTSGIIEPIVATGDMYIISGHQRVRACKELGIETILTEFKPYYLNDNYDIVLKNLIETNIRQRGIGNTNQRKMGLCIKELDRIYGIREGSAGKVSKNLESNNFTPKTEEELLKSLGLSVTRQTIQNYKKLTDMIPELEEIVTKGSITNTTAIAIMKQLSEEEQEKLIAQLDITKKYTQKQIQEYVSKMKQDEKIETIDNTDYTKIATLEEEIKVLRKSLSEMEKYKSANKQLEGYKKDYQLLQESFSEKVSELQKLRKQIQIMNETSTEVQYEKKLKDSTILFCSKVATFIEQVGGYVWLTDKINEIPELEREGYIKAIQSVKAWADTMINNINNKGDM